MAVTPSQYISPIQSNDSTDIGTEAGAIVLRYILNVVYRRYCSPHQPGEHGQSGLASPVPVHSRFDQADNLIHLNIGLAETVFKFNRTFSPIHSRTGNGYALPGTGITGNGIRGRSRLYFGKESDTIPWQETPPCSGNP